MEQDTIENVSLPIKLFKKVIFLNFLRTIFFCKIITYQGRLLITFFHPSKFFKYFMYALCRLNRCTFFTTTILSQDIAGRCHFCDYHSSRLRLEPRPSFFHTNTLAYTSLLQSKFNRKSDLLESWYFTNHSDGLGSTRNNLHVTRFAQGIAFGTKLF